MFEEIQLEDEKVETSSFKTSLHKSLYDLFSRSYDSKIDDFAAKKLQFCIVQILDSVPLWMFHIFLHITCNFTHLNFA